MDTLLGEGPLKIVVFVVVVLGLLALAFWLVRRFGGGRLGGGAARGRQPRLAVIDQANVDGRRRLVLIRRDNIEHLLIIGGPSDVVVEQNIVRAATAPREGAAARPSAADTLPRAVPLGEDGLWPAQPEPAEKAEAPPRVEPPPVRAEPRPAMASEEPMLWPGDRPSEPQAPAAPPLGAPPPAAPPFARERKARGADPLAELAEELARVPAVPESADQRRMPRLRPAPPSPEPPVKSPDQNLSEMAQRLEAALRRPAKGDDTRTAAPSPKSEPASEPFTAAPSPRPDATLRRPFKSDDLRSPLSPPKPANEPTAPAADEASADPASDTTGRGGDTKNAAGKSFYDSLEQEMASLLNRPPKP